MPEAPTIGRIAAAILAWLDAHGPATACEVAQACGMEEASVRGRLVMLARQGLAEAGPAGDRRVRVAYSATAEGRRRAPVST